MRIHEIIAEAPIDPAKIARMKARTQAASIPPVPAAPAVPVPQPPPRAKSSTTTPTTPTTPQIPTSLGQMPEKQPGFGAAIAGGFKAGLGMNPSQSFMQGMGAKTLGAAGMRATSQEINPEQGNPNSPQRVNTITPDLLQTLKVGSTFKHPKLGDMKVKSSSSTGVSFDTTRQFGHDLRLNPIQFNNLMRNIQGNTP